MVKSFEFTWEVTIHKSCLIDPDDVVGCWVWHQPADVEGEIVMIDGVLWIHLLQADYTDGGEGILLDSAEGREFISECKVWKNKQAMVDDELNDIEKEFGI